MDKPVVLSETMKLMNFMKNFIDKCSHLRFVYTIIFIKNH